MVSKNRSGLQVESLEGRRMLSVTPAAGQALGADTKSLNAELHAAGSNLGAICSAEEPGACATETIAFLRPPGRV